MVPAHERLDAHDGGVVEVVDGLVVQHELVGRQRVPQLGFELAPVRRGMRRLSSKSAQRDFPSRLARYIAASRVAQQDVAGRRVAASTPATVTIPMLTDTAASKSSNTIGCSRRSRIRVGERGGILDAAETFAHDDELVAAGAGDGVGLCGQLA